MFGSFFQGQNYTIKIPNKESTSFFLSFFLFFFSPPMVPWNESANGPIIFFISAGSCEARWSFRELHLGRERERKEKCAFMRDESLEADQQRWGQVARKDYHLWKAWQHWAALSCSHCHPPNPPPPPKKKIKKKSGCIASCQYVK